MKEPKTNPLADQAIQAYRNGVVNYVARLIADRMKQRMAEANVPAKGSELMLLFSRCAEKVGKQISDLLSDLLAERARTKADPMGYIAHVTAVAAKKVNQQTK